MLIVADVRKHRRHATAPDKKFLWYRQLNVVALGIPAVTHVDYSARIQTVDANTNPLFHRLLLQVEKTGCPALINTGFNVRGEPIVCRPDERFAALWAMNLIFLWSGAAYCINPSRMPG